MNRHGVLMAMAGVVVAAGVTGGLLWGQAGKDVQEELRLSVEAARAEYVKGTPVLLRITLRNEGGGAYTISGEPGPGWGRGLAIRSAGAGEELKELPIDAVHGDTEAGPLYTPTYVFKGRLDPGQGQSILQFIRNPEFPAGVRRFQAALYIGGRKIEAPEIVVSIREAAQENLAVFTAEERRIINGYAGSLHNYRRENRQADQERLRILPVVRKALEGNQKTVECEYAFYMGVLQAVGTRDATAEDVELAKRASQALLERFPDSWLVQPVREMLSRMKASDEEGGWGKAVNGLRCRLLPVTQTVEVAEGANPKDFGLLAKQKVIVTYEVENVGERAMKLLPRHTPLDKGMSQPIFEVAGPDGKQVKYLGWLGGGDIPEPKDFIDVKPGQRISRQVNLPYDFTMPGEYLISFETTPTRIAYASEVKAYYGGDIEKTKANPDNVWTGVMKSNTVTVKVVKK